MNVRWLVTFFACGLWSRFNSANPQVKHSSMYKDKIYRIPQDSQRSSIEYERNLCIRKIYEKYNQPLMNDTILKRCPMTWDKIKCWPETDLGITLEAKCPNYIDGFKTEGKVTKTCTLNGEWFSKNGYQWTNYSNCSPKKNNNTARHYVIIHTVGQIGYALSIFALIVASLIFLCFRRLNCERNKMHVSLYVSFVLRAMMYYIGLSDTIMKNTSLESIGFCRAMKATQNYTILANNTAVFVEALYLHNILFYHTFSSSGKKFCYYITLSWAFPAVVTLVWIILRINFDNEFCWDAHDDIYKRDFWLIQAYTIILTLGNFLIFIHLMKAIYTKMISQPVPEVTFSRRIMQSVTVLIIVFGVYNLVFIPIDILTAISPPGASVSSLELVKLYCEHIISSCQGLLVSILFCFNNREVKSELRRWIFRKINYVQSHQRTESIVLPGRKPNRHAMLSNSCSVEATKALA